MFYGATKVQNSSKVVGITRVVPHPGFETVDTQQRLEDVPKNNAAWAKDIALVVLDRHLNFDGSVQPACLPKPDQMQELYRDGRSALVAGAINNTKI